MRGVTWILTAVFAVSAAGATPQKVDPPVATIICYHVVESPYDTEFSITRDTFAEQMQYLAATGYRVVSLDDVHDYMTGKRRSLPRNAVVITVDDGYRSVYTEMYPLLKRYKYPFSVFIYPKWIGQSAYALTWAQIREMSSNGIAIESHGLSHSFLTRRHSGQKSVNRYTAWLNSELEESKETIQKHTGKSVRFLAYPYGDYDPLVARQAKSAGYVAGLTCDFGPVRKSSDSYRLRRIVIRKDTSLASFRKLLGTSEMVLEATEPLSGGRLSDRPPVVSAKIRDYQNLDPASVQMAVLSLGRTPFSYDPRDGTISLVVREGLEGKRQRAFVWGTDRKTGKRVEASWTFFLDSPPDPAPPVALAREGAALLPPGRQSGVQREQKRR